MPFTGAAAVQQSQQQNQLRGAAVAPTAAPSSAGDGRSSVVIQTVGDQTFLLRDGVWTDTQFDPSRMTTTKIEFNSDAYFALLANHPDWGKYLALGSRVIAIVNGTAYEITDNGSGASDANAAPTATPTPGQPLIPVDPQDVISPHSSALDLRLLVGGGMLGVGFIGSAVGLAVGLRKK